MRFEGEEHLLIGILVELCKYFGYLSVALSGRNDISVVVGVLYVYILDIRMQKLVAEHGVLLTEGKVAHVEHALHSAAEMLHDFKAVFRSFAVYRLLVLVAEVHIPLLGDFKQLFEPREHLFPELMGIGLPRAIKAEHTDVLCFKYFGNIYRVFKELEMLVEIVLKMDLSDRRADGGNADAVGIELLLDVLCLRKSE